MAKLKSLIKLQGTLDDITFFKGADGYYARTKGGVSKNRIMNDPAFTRTRENGMEFGTIATSGKLMRTAVGSMLFKAKDSKLSSRLVKVLSLIKNMDSENHRGRRNVSKGLEHQEAIALLEGFDFNNRAILTQVLNTPLSVNIETGGIAISPFNSTQHLRFPNGATHFSFKGAFLRIDFEMGLYEFKESAIQTFKIKNEVISCELEFESVPTQEGIGMHLLLIEFFQEVNGNFYPLNNGGFNVLNLVKIS